MVQGAGAPLAQLTPTLQPPEAVGFFRPTMLFGTMIPAMLRHFTRVPAASALACVEACVPVMASWAASCASYAHEAKGRNRRQESSAQCFLYGFHGSHPAMTVVTESYRKMQG